jgi:hypothetical protein
MAAKIVSPETLSIPLPEPEPVAPAVRLSPKLLKALQALATSEDQTLEALTTILLKEALTYRRMEQENARIGLGKLVKFFNDLGN